MPRVVEHYVCARIERYAIIRLAEESRGGGRDQWLNFADGDFLNARIARESAGGDSGAESDAEHGFWIRMQQGWKMADHPLQFHVVDFRGRFDVAVHIYIDRVVGPLRDRDRRIDSFGDVEHFRLSGVERHAAAVCDQFTGHRIDAPGQQTRDAY